MTLTKDPTMPACLLLSHGEDWMQLVDYYNLTLKVNEMPVMSGLIGRRIGMAFIHGAHEATFFDWHLEHIEKPTSEWIHKEAIGYTEATIYDLKQVQEYLAPDKPTYGTHKNKFTRTNNEPRKFLRKARSNL